MLLQKIMSIEKRRCAYCWEVKKKNIPFLYNISGFEKEKDIHLF